MNDPHALDVTQVGQPPLDPILIPEIRTQEPATDTQRSHSQGPRKIWIFGSSIGKRAGLAARDRIGGCLPNTNIWWQGYGGMILSQLLPKLRHLRTLQNDPNIIIVHCRGNSLGLVKLESLLEQLQPVILNNDSWSLKRWDMDRSKVSMSMTFYTLGVLC